MILALLLAGLLTAQTDPIRLDVRDLVTNEDGTPWAGQLIDITDIPSNLGSLRLDLQPGSGQHFSVAQGGSVNLRCAYWISDETGTRCMAHTDPIWNTLEYHPWPSTALSLPPRFSHVQEPGTALALPQHDITYDDTFPKIHRPLRTCHDALWAVVKDAIDVLSGRDLRIKRTLERAAEACE